LPARLNRPADRTIDRPPRRSRRQLGRRGARCRASRYPAHQLVLGADLGVGRGQRDGGRHDEGQDADPEDERQQEVRGSGTVHQHSGSGSLGEYVHGRHARVVHAADGHAHDQRGAEGRPDAAQPQGEPQSHRRRHDRDDHREQEQDRAIGHPGGHLHGRHTAVVHAGHPDAGDRAGEHKPTEAVAAEAHDEQPAAHHGYRDQHAQDGDQHVIADDLAGNRKAEHGDEVHDPDPRGADRYRREHQPSRPGTARVGAGPRGAAQAQEGAEAGHRVRETRCQQTIRKVMNRQHR
jgi:hypothetical protein